MIQDGTSDPPIMDHGLNVSAGEFFICPV